MLVGPRLGGSPKSWRPWKGTRYDLLHFSIFFAGILQDFLLTLNWRYIAKNRALPASVLSFFVTIVTMVVLYNILIRLDAQRSILTIIVYALGIGTGTYLGMKFKIGSDDGKK